MNQLQMIWKQLSAAPHRSLFLVGAFQGVFTLLWWWIVLAGRVGLVDNGQTWNIAPTWAHGFLMVYTFFPFFIMGFLFTVFPRWMNGELIRPQQYMFVSVLMTLGVAFFYIGLAVGQFLAVIGILLMLVGWARGVVALFKVLRSAPARDKRHAWITGLAFIAGWLGLCAYGLWLLNGNDMLLNFSRQVGIWFFLLPILLAVSHRMIPFFSSRVLEHYTVVRPYGLLWLMVGCSVAHGIFQQLSGLQVYTWIADMLLASGALYLTYVWQFFRSFKVRLLAVLHIAFAWLGIAMTLFALQGLLLWMSDGERYWFGLAPLHLLGVGYFTSMVIGMVSRVTLGHGGFSLVLDKFSWFLFVGFQAVIFLRVLPDIVPLSIVTAQGSTLYFSAAGVWLVCFTLWVAKYAPIYWRARVDGKVG